MIQAMPDRNFRNVREAKNLFPNHKSLQSIDSKMKIIETDDNADESGVKFLILKARREYVF